VGGVGLIITGGFPVYESSPPGEEAGQATKTFDDLCVEGIEQLADAVHRSRPGCKIVAQLETGYLSAGPSTISSPFSDAETRPLSIAEIRTIIDCFVQAIVRMKASGFDGVQLHGAHGGLLSCFLSPYTNRRTDEYGGSTANRARIVREIVVRAREKVGDWPILIKANCTDYVEGGTDIDTFLHSQKSSRLPELTRLKSAAACGTAWSGRSRTGIPASPRARIAHAHRTTRKAKLFLALTQKDCNSRFP